MIFEAKEFPAVAQMEEGPTFLEAVNSLVARTGFVDAVSTQTLEAAREAYKENREGPVSVFIGDVMMTGYVVEHGGDEKHGIVTVRKGKLVLLPDPTARELDSNLVTIEDHSQGPQPMVLGGVNLGLEIVKWQVNGREERGPQHLGAIATYLDRMQWAPTDS